MGHTRRSLPRPHHPGPHSRAYNWSTVSSGRNDSHPCHKHAIPLDPETRLETRQIARELAALARTGHVLPGTLTERTMRCGRASCRCHDDPPRRHGPYWQWTRKVKNKTITRWLSPQQAADYNHAIANNRRIRELLARLEAISIAHLKADQPRT